MGGTAAMWGNSTEPMVTVAQPSSSSGYGARPNGTEKGKGYFGELPMRDGSGKVATEMTAQADVNGESLEFPLIVPTLTEQELDSLLRGEKPTKGIYDKAIDHALSRKKQGMSVYAD